MSGNPDEQGEPTSNPYLPPDTALLAPPLTARQEELRRVGEALRALIAGLVATEAPADELAALADDLEGLAAGWAVHPRRAGISRRGRGCAGRR